jgi:hypothetical protein
MRSAGEPWVAHHVPGTSPRRGHCSSAGTPRRRPHSATRRAFGACRCLHRNYLLYIYWSLGGDTGVGCTHLCHSQLASPLNSDDSRHGDRTGARLSTPLRVGSILVREPRTGRSVRACQFPVSVFGGLFGGVSRPSDLAAGALEEDYDDRPQSATPAIRPLAYT